MTALAGTRMHIPTGPIALARPPTIHHRQSSEQVAWSVEVATFADSLGAWVGAVSSRKFGLGIGTDGRAPASAEPKSLRSSIPIRAAARGRGSIRPSVHCRGRTFAEIWYFPCLMPAASLDVPPRTRPRPHHDHDHDTHDHDRDTTTTTANPTSTSTANPTTTTTATSATASRPRPRPRPRTRHLDLDRDHDTTTATSKKRSPILDASGAVHFGRRLDWWHGGLVGFQGQGPRFAHRGPRRENHLSIPAVGLLSRYRRRSRSSFTSRRFAMASWRDQATRASKSCFLQLCEGLPNERGDARRKYFIGAHASLHETVGAVDLAATLDADERRRGAGDPGARRAPQGDALEGSSAEPEPSKADAAPPSRR